MLPQFFCLDGTQWSMWSILVFHLVFCKRERHFCHNVMNFMKLVIPLRFISWKKTPNDAVTPQRQSQFTPKMKANAVPRLLSSLVWIDQYNECNGMTSFVKFMPRMQVRSILRGNCQGDEGPLALGRVMNDNLGKRRRSGKNSFLISRRYSILTTDKEMPLYRRLS